MEFLRGQTLAERVRSGGRLTADAARPLVAQLAQGLEAAHAAGIVHRDFKSQNVMLVDGGSRAVITDFGLARAADPAEGAASSGSGGLVGSPAYMAPEQVAGQAVGAAADLYALGVVLYEMVTGRWPFVGETPMLTAIKRLSEAPVPPTALVPDLDLAFSATILRCLERSPEARPASALAVAAALHGAAARAPQRRRVLWTSALVGAAGLSLLAFALHRRGGPEPHPSAEPPAVVQVASPERPLPAPTPSAAEGPTQPPRPAAAKTRRRPAPSPGWHLITDYP
jgi:serine/threonine protein kinase